MPIGLLIDCYGLSLPVLAVFGVPFGDLACQDEAIPRGIFTHGLAPVPGRKPGQALFKLTGSGLPAPPLAGETKCANGDGQQKRSRRKRNCGHGGGYFPAIQCEVGCDNIA